MLAESGEGIPEVDRGPLVYPGVLGMLAAAGGVFSDAGRGGAQKLGTYTKATLRRPL